MESVTCSPWVPQCWRKAPVRDTADLSLLGSWPTANCTLRESRDGLQWAWDHGIRYQHSEFVFAHGTAQSVESAPARPHNFEGADTMLMFQSLVGVHRRAPTSRLSNLRAFPLYFCLHHAVSGRITGKLRPKTQAHTETSVGS